MKGYFKIIACMLLFCFSQMGCRKSAPCDGLDTYFYYPIHDSQRKLIPYTGNEVLAFINNYGDTAICFGEGIGEGFTKEVNAFNEDCGEYSWNYYQYLIYTFKDPDGKLDIKWTHYWEFQGSANVTELYLNQVRIYPLWPNFLVPEKYNDTASSVQNQYQVVRMNDGKGHLAYHNADKGFVKIILDSVVWRLWEY